MELKDTVELMLSDDWKDRLKAEAMQLDIRIERLKSAVVRMNKEKKAGHYNDHLPVFRRQLRYMNHYRKCLSERLFIIELTANARKD